MKAIILLLLALPILAVADCPDLYPNNTPIPVKNTVELCNSFYVSVYDVHNKAVIYTSERLRKGSPVGSADRVDSFRSDPRIGRIPSRNQYVNTGFDRGHMTPADDASDFEEMEETFWLTNITPQSPKLNRGEWKRLETIIRTMYQKSKTDVYVVTVAEYKSDEKVNGIPVPTGYWKFVFIDGKSSAFYAENKDTAKVVKRTGVSFKTVIQK